MVPKRFFLLAVCLFGFMPSLAASSLDDLASPLQAKRDAAAKSLRATYSSAPPAGLKAALDKLRLGISQYSVLWRLRAFHPSPTISISSGGSHTENYELDGGWLLHCAFGRKDETPWVQYSVLLPSGGEHDKNKDELFSYDLYLEIKLVPAEPPAGFTGRWVTYYVNGQKGSERRYVHGRLLHERKYDDDGKPAGSRGKSSSDDPMLRLGG